MDDRVMEERVQQTVAVKCPVFRLKECYDLTLIPSTKYNSRQLRTTAMRQHLLFLLVGHEVWGRKAAAL
eukprot:790840-Pelagomonas_calceolata.AAC.3